MATQITGHPVRTPLGRQKVTPGTDINAAAVVEPLPLASFTATPSGLAHVQAGVDSLVVLTDAWYRLESIVGITGVAAARYGGRLMFRRNGAPMANRAKTSYIRVSSGHTESSLHLVEFELLAAGDVIDLRVERFAATINPVTVDSGSLVAQLLEVA